MPVTTGMVGHGFYNENSAPQMSAIAHVLPWLDGAVADIDLDRSSGTIAMADFGCSEGHNSIAVMKRLVRMMRGRTERHIQTIHSDLATNDFSHLFKELRPVGRSVFGDDGTSSCAVGGSMFDRLLPPGSVHLATTFNAIGFLSRRPLDRLPGYILPNGPSPVRGVGEVTDSERKAFAGQARQDVAAFLRARSIELAPGGKLLLQVFGADSSASTSDGIYDVLNDAVLEVLEVGMIDRAAYDDYYQPVYFRTLEELVQPVSEEGLAFRIDRQETYEAPVPFNTEFARAGDVETYARDYTNFFRAFTEAVLRLAFASHPNLESLIDEVYRRAQTLVQAHPDRYPFRYMAIAALLTKLD